MKATFYLLFLMHALIAPGQAKPDSLIPLPPLHTITPSSDWNYTIHYRPHLPVKSISRRLGLSEAEATINYFDGLRRCIQTVEKVNKTSNGHSMFWYNDRPYFWWLF